MRLFTGLSVPPDTGAKLLKSVRDRKAVPPGNLHVTTKFIGEWPEVRLGELISALEAMDGVGELAIEVCGFGRFPKALFARVTPSAGLELLAERTETALAGLGVERENRPYTPHITLVRSGEPAHVAEPEARCFGSFQACEFHLYESKMQTYSKLRTFSLK